MASGKRQPSKQKRTNQNRQQRAALQARKAAASNAAAAPAAPPAGSSSGSGGGLLGRLRGCGRLRAAAHPRLRAAHRLGRRRRPAGPRPPAGPTRRSSRVGYRAALTGAAGGRRRRGRVSFIRRRRPVDGQATSYTAERSWPSGPTPRCAPQVAEAPTADADAS